MNRHNILSVTHLSPKPADGYGPDAPVKIVYLDGQKASGQWGSDVGGGGVLAWRAEHGDEAAGAYVEPDPAPPAPPVPRLAATALLTIAEGEVGGFSAAAGLAFGFVLSPGVYWLFFAQEMPNLNYAYTVTASQGSACVTDRQTSYMEITVLDGETPVDPAELSLQVFRAD